MQKPDGIKGLKGREPVGVVLSVGVKDKQRGFPTETDRFHLVAAREENGVRNLHPGFATFNTAAIEKRKGTPSSRKPMQKPKTNQI